MKRSTLPIAVALALLAGTASASDAKMSTGADCKPLSNTQLDSFYYRPTSVQNISSGMRYISCPVMIDGEALWDTDDVAGGTDNGFADLHLTLDYSQNVAGGTTTCTAQIIDKNTNAFVETRTVSVAGVAGDSSVPLTIANLIQGDSNDRALAFNCNLPSMVRLTTLNLNEEARTDDEAP